MRPAHPTEQTVGMAVYVSDTDGIGGQLRARDDDFVVTELERFDTESLDADPGGYPHVVFRATLRGWDTNDFARRLSNGLGISRERVSWAGTKDKHAVTTQLFSVRATDAVEFPSIDGVTIEVLGRAGRAIEFGDLVGNSFELTIREPSRPENVTPIAEELAAFGGFDGADAEEPDTVSLAVPNYFGQQRFGSRRPITAEVGLAIVRRDWEGAVMAYLGNPHEAEPAETRAARQFVEETRDWTAAIDRFPRGLRFERSLLNALAEADGEPGADAFRDALERLPSNLRRLFVHAAQSYAFNLILSERLERGLPFDHPVDGDVVCFSDRDAPGSLVVPDVSRTQRVTSRRRTSIERHCERGRAFVTAPLVGTETTLATGEQGDIERAVLETCGLSQEAFDLPGEYYSTGTRRAILLRTTVSVETDPVVLSFTLPKGAYATVIAREFLKVDPQKLG